MIITKVNTFGCSTPHIDLITTERKLMVNQRELPPALDVPGSRTKNELMQAKKFFFFKNTTSATVRKDNRLADLFSEP